MEPNDPPRDYAPAIVRGGTRQITLLGAESDMVWTAILAGNSEQVIKAWDEVSTRHMVG